MPFHSFILFKLIRFARLNIDYQVYELERFYINYNPKLITFLNYSCMVQKRHTRELGTVIMYRSTRMRLSTFTYMHVLNIGGDDTIIANKSDKVYHTSTIMICNFYRIH